MRLTRWLVRSGILFGVLGLLVLPVRAEDPDWTVSILPSGPGWELTLPADVNAAGVICGTYVDEGEYFYRQRPVVWRDGGIEKIGETIGLPDDRGFAFANALNDAGIVVGSAYDLDGKTKSVTEHATVWDLAAETVTDVHPDDLDYEESGILDVDESGQMAGVVLTFDFPNGVIEQRAYLWDGPDSSDGTLLPFPEGSDFELSYAFAVHESGLVAGWMQEDLFVQTPHATVWLPDGRVLDLHDDIVELDEDMVWTRAFGIDSDGRVLGHAWDAAFETGIPWTWTEDGGVEMLDTGSEEAFFVNAGTGCPGDIVVGAAGDLSAGDQRGAVWIDGFLTTLPLPSGIRNMWCTSVSDEGVIVGYAIRSPNSYWYQGSDGFIARPVPDAERSLASLLCRTEHADLPAGLATALAAKLSGALEDIEDGKDDAAAGKLRAYENQVRAQRGKAIPVWLADILLEDSEEIRDLIG